MIKLPAIPKNLKNKRVLVRADFNVPMEGKKVMDQFRILQILPTIKFLSRKRAKVILISHLEIDGRRPSLFEIYKVLKPKLKKLKFSPQIFGKKTESMSRALNAGDILLLENLRKNPGEKNNSPDFARKLASFGDFYINEAFSVSHRRHASIVGVPKYLPSFAGPLFRKEVKNLARVFKPARPFLLIVGGNKLETKIPLLKKFLKKADKIVLGGAIVAPFLLGKVRNFKSPKIVLPKDLIVLRGGARKTIQTQDIYNGDSVYDLGPKSIVEISKLVKTSRMILWNGPLGYIEIGFSGGTKRLAEILFKSSAKTIVGGGDTVGFLHRRKMLKKFYFVSTAGGAMLDFLVSGTLSGIEALKK